MLHPPEWHGYDTLPSLILNYGLYYGRKQAKRFRNKRQSLRILYGIPDPLKRHYHGAGQEV